MSNMELAPHHAIRHCRPEPVHLPGLALLRAIAVLWIMLYHVTSYGPVLPGLVEFGYMGVDLFFVLSGFLIGEQLLRPYAHGARPAWRQFYLRRALRVLPAYLAVVALYFTVPSVRESPEIQPLWQFLTFTQNFFADYHHARALSHAWSLCIEEHFYLVLPPIVWLLAKKPSARWIAVVAAALLIGGMLLRHWLWQHQVAPFLSVRDGQGNFFERYIEQIYNPSYTRLDGLLAGVMLALVKIFRPAWWSWALNRKPWFLASGAIGIGATMMMPAPAYISAVFGFPLLSASMTAIVISSASPQHWSGRMRIPGVAPIAAMAFSLYLTNKSIYHLVSVNFGDALDESNLLSLCVYLGAALAAGGVLYITVERPGLRLRERFSSRSRAN